MPSSKNIAHYSDVRMVLDTAIRLGGAKWELPTPGRAINWRQRAFVFKKLALQLAAQSTIPGLIPSTPYDLLDFVIDKAEPCVVRIQPMIARGVLKDMSGNVTEIVPASTATPTVEVPTDVNDLIKKLSL